MSQVTFMFDNPVLLLVNSVLLLGIVLAVVVVPRLNRITEEQRKRNIALHRENVRLNL